MKTMFSAIAFCALLGFALTATRAAEAAADTTVKGTMKCAKCSLKEATACQAVLVTKEGDKEVKYFLTGKEAKAAHDEICKKDKENVSVTGKVTEKDGKKMIAATKVE